MNIKKLYGKYILTGILLGCFISIKPMKQTYILKKDTIKGKNLFWESDHALSILQKNNNITTYDIKERTCQKYTHNVPDLHFLKQSKHSHQALTALITPLLEKKWQLIQLGKNNLLGETDIIQGDHTKEETSYSFCWNPTPKNEFAIATKNHIKIYTYIKKENTTKLKKELPINMTTKDNYIHTMYSPSGKYIALKKAGTLDYSTKRPKATYFVEILDIENNRLVTQLELSSYACMFPCTHVAFLAIKGIDILMTIEKNKIKPNTSIITLLKIEDTKTTILKEIIIDEEITRIALSPDGNTVAFTSRSSNKHVKYINLMSESSTEITNTEEHKKPISRITFCPNGKYIASLSDPEYDNKELIIWKNPLYKK